MSSIQKKGLIGFGGILGIFLLWYILKKIGIVVDAVFVVGGAIGYIHLIKSVLKIENTLFIDGIALVLSAIITVAFPLPIVSYIAMGIMAATGVDMYEKFVLNKQKNFEE
ncbi:MAG: hypothetical protein U9Q66_01105 [Patescibacteria group bacterium]|nr:hypothetical protein [Patescibacteria group bacterium]